MQRVFRVLIMAVLLLGAGSAYAVQPDEVLDDPVLEQRAREISAGLRCLVCQNQSIDDSDAPLAKDLRILVRERLTAGDSNPEVVQYLVDRYGEFVLLKPRFGLHTLILWISAPLVFVVGIFVFWRNFRRRNQLVSGDAIDLSAQEIQDLANLLDREADTSGDKK
ncbi:MAG: cytochrome c-type biogenesis protein CcmH [Fimbriimonadaceae bacterium]|nr:cytochrome c-type biogenesis protein CcmH [Alphaproteobacteria bacterium]